MTMNELLSRIQEILPNASVGEDNDGQIVIYTNLVEANESLVDMGDT